MNSNLRLVVVVCVLVFLFVAAAVGQEYCPSHTVTEVSPRVVHVPPTVVQVPQTVVEVPPTVVHVPPTVIRPQPVCPRPYVAVPAPIVVSPPHAVTLLPSPYVTRYSQHRDSWGWLFLPKLTSVEEIFSGPNYSLRKRTGPLGFSTESSFYDSGR